MSDRFVCTKDNPWSPGKPTPVQHPDASEVGDQLDGWPSGDLSALRNQVDDGVAAMSDGAHELALAIDAAGYLDLVIMARGISLQLGELAREGVTLPKDQMLAEAAALWARSVVAQP